MQVNNPSDLINTKTAPLGSLQLANHNALLFKQRREMAELFGFETRNKYEIFDEQQRLVGFAAEQQKGFLASLVRQFIGHWRSFEINFYNTERWLVLKAHHPFRFFFQRLDIYTPTGTLLGSVQQRISILTKRFDILNARGMTIMQVSSPIWRIWTFPFMHNGLQIANVSKKWTGFFNEAFTDKDNFIIEYSDPTLKEEERALVLAAGLFIDLQYFEKKANVGASVLDVFD